MNDQNYYFKQNGDMIDISSTTSGNRPTVNKSRPQPIKAYGNGISRHLGVIIKIISFIIAFACLAIGGVLALLLYRLDGFFASIALAIFILSAVIATISLFVFYGIGHVICQNNEILRRLNEE